MPVLRPLFCASLVLFAVSGLVYAASDPGRGMRTFAAQCAACHSVSPGEQLTGPSLAQIWHRRAGTVEGFARYSMAMKRADIVWHDATLDQWLANPGRLMPGTSMTHPGLEDARDRGGVIAYLRAVSEGRAPQAEKGRPRPGSEVTEITHCEGTYTVTTSDGMSREIRDSDLQFRTDSSNRGPRPGHPVVAAAGARSESLSIVFASPAEMSHFIKPSCR